MLESQESIQKKEDTINIPFICAIIFWIFQIITWIGILSFILLYILPKDIIIKNNKDRESFSNYTTLGLVLFSLFFLGMPSYAIYLIYEINYTSILDYLDEFDRHGTIIEEIKYLLQSKPMFQISLYNLNNCEGISTLEYTDHIDKRFKFISCRDISGKFTLNSHCCIPKSYVILNVNYEIGFADDGTLSDYEKEKKKFINENKNKFSYQVHEFKYLNIMKPKKIIIINKSAKCFINSMLFFFYGFELW